MVISIGFIRIFLSKGVKVKALLDMEQAAKRTRISACFLPYFGLEYGGVIPSIMGGWLIQFNL
jgi:hypothetical protein